MLTAFQVYCTIGMTLCIVHDADRTVARTMLDIDKSRGAQVASTVIAVLWLVLAWPSIVAHALRSGKQ
jgi:hypothetical protein